MVTLHGSGIPHVDTLGVSPWVQWGVIGVILLVGCWLMLDVCGRSAVTRRLVDDRTETFDGPLVVGKSRREETGVADAQSAVSAPVVVSPVAEPAPASPEVDGEVDERSRDEGGAFARAWGAIATQRLALPIWLNPIRVLAAILGLGAGIQAMDRVQAIMELDSMLGTVGTLQVSRAAIWLTVLFCVGGTLAMPVPKLAAVAFLGAAALAAFFAVAGWWESKLEWWGAEYALTAWSNLWAWAGVGLGLAVLAVLGGWYRPRRRAGG